MENETTPSASESKSFRKFLNESNNLISIFGVCNALFIYSSTLGEKGPGEFLIPSFFMLSAFVWLELIMFAFKSNDGSRKYEIFIFLLAMVELGLIEYFIQKFTGLIILAFFFLLLLGIMFLVIWPLPRLFKRLLKKAGPKWRENWAYLMVLFAMGVAVLILKFSSPLIKPVINWISKDSAQVKSVLKK